MITEILLGLVIGIVYVYLKGKKVAFIGMKGSGKTTAVHAFQAIEHKEQGWKADNDNPGTMGNDTYDDVLGFKVCIDTSGAQELKRNWEKTISEVDWVFYFFDISRLDEIVKDENGDVRYRKLVKADLVDIAEICKRKNKKILVIATHSDVQHDEKKAEQYCSDILQVLRDYEFVKGSLRDYNSACDLVNEISKRLKK